MPRSPKDPIDAIGDALPDFLQGDTNTAAALRRAAMRDPLPGGSMLLTLRGASEPIEVPPGKWLDMGAVDPRTGLPLGCPVTPLGKDGQTAWFLDTLGAVVSLEAASSGKGPIGSIFAGRSRWLEWAFPRWSKGSEKHAPEVIGWQADDARQTLIDACAFLGQFSLEDQVRGRGAWRDFDGALVYHAGDAVWIRGRWRPPGEHDGFIYPACPGALGRPSAKRHAGGEGSDGHLLFELLQTFAWDRGELDALLMLGWIMTAKIGGALRRRPVAFITGGEGTGKSTLQELARTVMNGALIATSNTTQAGIYQHLRFDSVAMLVDELEAKDDTRTVDRIIELARICYSGDRMQRGGQDGVGKTFALHSSFLGCAIAKPAMDAQDESRMVALMLRERDPDAPGLDTNDHDVWERIGSNLLKRIFDAWPQWDQLIAAFRTRLIRSGHTDRACDTLAPLAAGAHLAMWDGLPDQATLDEWARRLDPRELAEVADREKTWRRCLMHLLEAQPSIWASPSKTWKSVGQVFERLRDRADGAHADLDDYLPQVGLAVSWPADDGFHAWETARLFVPSKHPALHALFEGTPWAGRAATPGPWLGVLRQMSRRGVLWEPGKCAKGLDRKAAGIFIHLAKALEA